MAANKPMTRGEADDRAIAEGYIALIDLLSDEARRLRSAVLRWFVKPAR